METPTNESIKKIVVKDSEIIKQPIYKLRVSLYHEDDKKIGFRPYPGTDFKSYMGLEWLWKDKGNLIEKVSDMEYYLHTTKSQLDKKDIDLSRCVFEVIR